jgi:N-acetylmuramic acid 6-phosphate (MurNAc-6-P) etherase
MSNILDYLKIIPTAQSVDYIENKKQFHLYTLLTEQRHPKTWTLSSTIGENTEEGLKMLLAVDGDITAKIDELSQNPDLLENAVDAMYRAIKSGKKIYFYGCGATGRLAKQMESTFWRPFWKSIRESELWDKLKNKIPSDIGEHLIGEMTGADRALISSLEGFEDLQLIGRLQLNDRGVEPGDAVFCVTEGGETSSVIGTILTAWRQYGEPSERGNEEAQSNLYFAYNNPDDRLLPFERSRSVIENRGITKLNFSTGPQGITGSTRLQATTSETFILGAVLEEAIYRILKEHLNEKELTALGFEADSGLVQRLRSFRGIKKSVDNSVSDIAGLTDLEAETYSKGHYSTYFAGKSLVTVFIDSTERSPTFKLYPLDTVNEPKRRSWIQVWTDSNSKSEAWQVFLGRSFRGLEESFYKQPFLEEIDDTYLREVAIKSLANAGNDQQDLYDFSFSEANINRFGPEKGDTGIIVCVDDELYDTGNPANNFFKFRELVKSKGGKVAVVSVTDKDISSVMRTIEADVKVDVHLPPVPDPIGLRRQIALKMLLNAHSTAMMAKLGRVTGNTMTNVNPSNLKLVGRATFLIMSHVNDAISNGILSKGYGDQEPVTFEEVNAVLYDAIDYMAIKNPGQTAEVALSIIRMIEALRQKKFVSWDEAVSILNKVGLNGYLQKA